MVLDGLRAAGEPRPERVALYSILFNLALIAAKYGLGSFSGSLALKADALHSFSDLASSGAVLAGIRLSRRRLRAFPYGLYKVENLVALGISALIFLAGYEIARLAFEARRVVSHILPTTLGVLLLMAPVFLFYRFEERWGRRLRSPSLIADASEFKADMFTSAAVIVGLLSAYAGLMLDRWVALLIAVVVARTGFGILRDAVRVLLDASLDFATLDKVKTITLSEPAVGRIEALHGRNSGAYKFIEMVITLKVRQLEEAHDISRRIEDRIGEEIPHVDSVLIHYEPARKETTTYGVPLLADRKRLSGHFGEAPFFGLITTKGGQIIREAILPNPYAREEKGKGLKIGRWLLGEGVDVILTLESIANRGPGYVFKEAGVGLETTELKDLNGVRQLIISEREANSSPQEQPSP